MLAIDFLHKLLSAKKLEPNIQNSDLRDRFAQTIGELLEEDPIERRRIQDLVEARNDARRLKNWSESDRIRDELSAIGIVIKDNRDGTTSWEVKR